MQRSTIGVSSPVVQPSLTKFGTLSKKDLLALQALSTIAFKDGVWRPLQNKVPATVDKPIQAQSKDGRSVTLEPGDNIQIDFFNKEAVTVSDFGQPFHRPANTFRISRKEPFRCQNSRPGDFTYNDYYGVAPEALVSNATLDAGSIEPAKAILKTLRDNKREQLATLTQEIKQLNQCV
jgi:hypothetical protein